MIANPAVQPYTPTQIHSTIFFYRYLNNNFNDHVIQSNLILYSYNFNCMEISLWKKVYSNVTPQLKYCNIKSPKKVL